VNTYGSIEPDARTWVLPRLEDVTDEQLVELDEYLLAGPSRQLLDPADLPWESGTFHLFVSHTHTHAALAGKMRTYFKPWRIDAFVAHEDIDPTRQWEQVIEAALGSCHALAALITPDFVPSKWCDQEVGYCLARKVPIVPVKLDADDPHGFIAKFQAVTPRRADDAAWAADAIFRALARHPALRALMAGPVVYRFAASRSFDGARANFALLQEVSASAWTRELVETAERAAVDNSQIANANVVEPSPRPMPEALDELLAPVREALDMNASELPTSDDDIPF
jgi:hypothetical protein